MRARVLIPLVVAAACTTAAPRDVIAGLDACEFCRMTVSDVRFAGQVQTRTGKVHAFDAVECLASFVLESPDRDAIRLIRVTDYETSRLLPVDSAVFLEGSALASPMGRSLVAFAASQDPSGLRHRYGGRVLTWSTLLDRLRAARLAPGADSSGTDARAGHGSGR